MRGCLIVTLVALFGTCCSSLGRSAGSVQEIGDSVSLCTPDIDPLLVSGRADFTVIYRLELDPAGSPMRTEVQLLRNGVGRFEECLATWRLPSVVSDK
jgi:hypothetical protein